MLFSDELRAMARPRRTYATLARLPGDGREGRRLFDKVAFTLLVTGAFVPLTSAGRLAGAHVAFTIVFWSFVPALQLGVVALLARAFAPRVPLVRALVLYLVGHGPWFLFASLLAGVCLFAPNVYGAMMTLLSSGVLPGLFVLTFAWGTLLTWAFFRAGLGLAGGRAAIATALFYVGYVGSIILYFHLTDQIRPEFFWTGR